jgi:chloramphenicol 3-O phosphotransferase
MRPPHAPGQFGIPVRVVMWAGDHEGPTATCPAPHERPYPAGTLPPRCRSRAGTITAADPRDLGQCYRAPVSTQVIVLNGASSSGKTSIARNLQGMLPTPWLLLGIDDLIRAIPDKGIEDGTLLHIRDTGQVVVGPGWRRLEASWYVGIATIAASGTGVIVDEVFLDGGGGQDRLRTALSGLGVLWVGVTCDRDVAMAREALRPDRVGGQSESQAIVVHEGVTYDLIVDTSLVTSESCAASVLERVLPTA